MHKMRGWAEEGIQRKNKRAIIELTDIFWWKTQRKASCKISALPGMMLLRQPQVVRVISSSF